MLTSALGTPASWLGNITLGFGANTGSQTFTKTISEAVTFSETYTSIYDKHGINESLTFSETWSAGVNNLISESVTFSDSMTENVVWARSLTDTLSFNELASADTEFAAAATDTLTFTDEFTRDVLADFTDTLVFSDTMTSASGFNRSILDILLFTTTTVPEIMISKRLLHILNFTDKVTFVNEIPLSITESITLSDELVQEYIYRTATDSLTLIETLTNQYLPVRINTDSLVFLETLSLQADYIRQPTDNLTFNDRCFATVADRYMLFFGVVNSIALPPPEFNDNYAMQGKTIIKRVMSGSVRTYNKTSQFEKMHYDFIVTRSQANAFRDFLFTEFGNVIYIYDWEGRRFQAKLLSDDIAIEEVGRWEPCGNKVRFSIEFLGRLYA